jgi:hypothetical protein
MEFLFNEQSLHGQFSDVPEFAKALDDLMEMRMLAKRYNHELYCHRNCAQVMVTHNLSLPQVIQHIDKNKARVLMGWLGQTGPYWDDNRCHPANEYLECCGKIVTDTAIGECAFLQFSEKKAQLISMQKSSWTDYLLRVIWYKDENNQLFTDLINHVSSLSLESELQNASPPIKSWAQMSELCLTRFNNLHFASNAFEPLQGKPFMLAAANAIIDLLHVLSRFKGAHQPITGRSEEGQRLYQQYFTGERAWFSDSSLQEKAAFKESMTFPHPNEQNEKLFCTFHGKVQTPQMRIHFSWPVTAEHPLYIVYVGDKITKT